MTMTILLAITFIALVFELVSSGLAFHYYRRFHGQEWLYLSILIVLMVSKRCLSIYSDWVKDSHVSTVTIPIVAMTAGVSILMFLAVYQAGRHAKKLLAESERMGRELDKLLSEK